MSVSHVFGRLTKSIACLALPLSVMAVPAAADPVQVAASGDVVTARAINAPGFLYANVWTITYRSTSATGQSNVVSGTVIVPKGSNANRPIVGYAPGTHGLGDQCAPSAALARGDEVEGLLIHQYATRGFAVAVTDYEGLGTPGDHTYVAGRAEGNAVLDIVRAAQRLPGSGLSPSAPVAIVGYSQGGHAAGWAAQLAPGYTPELNLKAFSVGAPPANLRVVADHNDGGPNVGLVFAAGVGLDAAYPDISLDPFLNDAGRAGFADIRDDCTGEFSKYAGRRLSDFTTTDVLNRPEWTRRVNEQNLGARTARVPVLLYHSNQDEILPVSVSVALRSSWCAGGTNLTFWRLNTGPHAVTAGLVSPAVTGWVADRLAGRATGNNC